MVNRNPVTTYLRNADLGMYCVIRQWSGQNVTVTEYDSAFGYNCGIHRFADKGAAIGFAESRGFRRGQI